MEEVRVSRMKDISAPRERVSSRRKKKIIIK
jgi:hypothetical protein